MENKFSYFKKSWGKWACLACAAVYWIFFFMTLRETLTLASLDIFSAEELNSYILHQKFILTFQFIIAFGFTGAFAGGFICKTKKTALLYDFILTAFISSVLGALLILWFKDIKELYLMCILFVCLAVLSISALYKYLKEK